MIRQSIAALFLGATLGVLAAGPAAAEDLEFELINESSLDIVQFFTSPTDVGQWEEDVLGSGTLNAGETARVTIADGRSQCDYDMRFVFADGSDFTDTANLCETGSYTLSDE